jgi:hypothetical protein
MEHTTTTSATQERNAARLARIALKHRAGDHSQKDRAWARANMPQTPGDLGAIEKQIALISREDLGYTVRMPRVYVVAWLLGCSTMQTVQGTDLWLPEPERRRWSHLYSPVPPSKGFPEPDGDRRSQTEVAADLRHPDGIRGLLRR